MRSRFAILCAVGLSLCLGAGALLAAAPEPDDPWPNLARDIFKGRPLADGSGVISIEMPYRAEDAAIVPVTLRTALAAGDPRAVKTITLVIDQNPSPVAATFTVDPSVSTI
jgi:sulfur-oxidizing protein SoxY